MADPAYIDADTGVLTDPEAWLGLGSVTLSSDTATVVFTSPNDGSSTDWSQFLNLVIIGSARSDRSAGSWDNIEIALNNDTANYRRKYVYGDGSAVTYTGAGNRIAAHIPCEDSDDLIFGSYVWHLLDINSAKFKSMLFHNSAEVVSTGAIVEQYGMTWRSQEAIWTIKLSVKYGSNFKQHSTWSLFGEFPRMVS